MSLLILFLLDLSNSEIFHSIFFKVTVKHIKQKLFRLGTHVITMSSSYAMASFQVHDKGRKILYFTYYI